MEPIETKEIRGLSIKLIISVIGATVTIVGTTLSTYNSLVKQIDEVRYQKSSDDRVLELRLKTLETTVEALKTQQQYTEQRVNRNAKSIEEK